MSLARRLDAPAQAGPVLLRLSAGLARLEAGAAGLMAAATLVICVLGAVLRYLGAPLLWADEAAITAMTWGAFLGASALFGQRGHMAMDYLPERLGPAGRRLLQRLADAVVLLAFLGLCVLIWRWFDLPGLFRAGSAEALAQESFNFIWLEPTQTLGLRKVWVWLVLPLFALGGTLHSLAHLAGRRA